MPPGLTVREVKIVSVVPGVAVEKGICERAGVKYGIGRSVNVVFRGVPIPVTWLSTIEDFAGERLRGDLALLLSFLDVLGSTVVLLVHLTGEADFCLFGDLVLALVTVIRDPAWSRKGMILLARAMGYDVATNSQGSRSVRFLWEKSGCLWIIWIDSELGML